MGEAIKRPISFDNSFELTAASKIESAITEASIDESKKHPLPQMLAPETVGETERRYVSALLDVYREKSGEPDLALEELPSHLFKSKQESSEYRKPIAIQYLIRQNDEQYVDNLISSDTEDSILEYLTEQLNNDNHHLIDELIRRNSESRDGLLFLRNLVILNRREGMIKYVEYVETHLCIPEQEDSSADITMQIRKIESVSLSDLIIKLLELAYNPCFNDNIELGLKAALDSLLYRMCQKHPNEMLSYLQTLDLNDKNEMLKTRYNYYMTIINNELKAVSDSPWTFGQAIEYIKTIKN